MGAFLEYILNGFRKIKTISSQKYIEDESDYIPDIKEALEPVTKYGRSDFLKFWFMGLIVVYVGYLAYGVIDTIYLIILGYILSIAVESYIGWMIQKGVSRGFAIFWSYLSLIGIIIAGAFLVVPFFAGQISDLIEIFIQYFTIIQAGIAKLGIVGYINALDMPIYVKHYIDAFTNDPQYLANLQDLLLGSIDAIVKQGTSYVGNAGILIFSTIKGLASALFQIGLTLTTAILFSIDQQNILRYINKITKSRNISNKIKEIYIKIGYRLRSQFILCLVIFITVYIGLRVLEIFGLSIPNKLSLALISGITELIPYIGPFLGSMPGVLVASISNGRIGFISAGIMYFVVQWTENNVFIPTLMNKALGVSPVLIFICVLIGGMAMGMVGVILAIPVSIIISVMSE